VLVRIAVELKSERNKVSISVQVLDSDRRSYDEFQNNPGMKSSSSELLAWTKQLAALTGTEGRINDISKDMGQNNDGDGRKTTWNGGGGNESDEDGGCIL
jgi:hypothetical protein